MKQTVKLSQKQLEILTETQKVKKEASQVYNTAHEKESLVSQLIMEANGINPTNVEKVELIEDSAVFTLKEEKNTRKKEVKKVK